MSIFSEEHKIFRNSLRTFVKREIVPFVDEWEKIGEIPRSLWKKMAEQHYLCTWIDEKYGGSGVGFEYSVIIIEELARANAGLGIAGHNDTLSPYIVEYGSEEQKMKWLPGVLPGTSSYP